MKTSLRTIARRTAAALTSIGLALCGLLLIAAAVLKIDTTGILLAFMIAWLGGCALYAAAILLLTTFFCTRSH